MLCPFKFGRYKFEGGEECHKDCAWRVGGYCAISIIANDKLARYIVARDWESYLCGDDEQGEVTP